MAQKPPKLLGLVAVVLLATAGTGAIVLLSKKSDTVHSAANPTPTTSPTTPAVSSTVGQSTTSSSAAPTSATTTSSTYKNGTYTATGDYDTPDSYETIGVTLTLQNDVVTNVSIHNSGSRESAEYQARFASSYKQYVVGKAISSISLSRVSGSSLTSTGFNSALQAIKSQAKA